MMNVLADKFPTSVEIDGVEYELNTDFRVGLNIMLAFEDPELTSGEKNRIMVELLYKEIPPDQRKARDLAVLFLDCGETGRGDSSRAEPRLYSFTHDAKYIYSAIRQTHGIDLETAEYLHWWKFCFLFLDLDPDCFFQQMIHLRRQKHKGKLTKEEQVIYNSMIDILELPVLKDPETQAAEQAFMEKLKRST